MSLKSPFLRRIGTAAAAAAVTALALAGCVPQSSSTSGSDGSTLVAYTGQSGDYQLNFNPYSPTKIGGLGTIFESLF
ncbi:MAG: ABC transporter substrate-binding protein, partial [Mycetocola sp.]